MYMCSVMSESVTVAWQTPMSMEFSKQEYWSGWPFPTPGNLPDPGIEPTSPALASRFSLPLCQIYHIICADVWNGNGIQRFKGKSLTSTKYQG